MRFKVVFTLILTLVYVGASYSQNPLWTWAESAGGLYSEYGNAVCTDANGNVYVTGTFQGQTFSIGDFTLYNNSQGSLDIFIAKFDEAGNVLWAKSGGGSNADYAYGICTDSQGNVFITGYFLSSTVSFGATELSNTSTNSNCPDIFLTKYDSDGNVVWSRSAVGMGCERAQGVAADSEGNVYIVGYFWNNNVSFEDHMLINQGSFDGFLAKYDVNGNVVWAKQIAGSDSDLCEDVFVDTQDNILVTGSFQNTAQFGNNTVVSPNEGTYQEVFAAKFDSEGNNIWAECALVPFFGNYASGNGIASDAEGNIYLTGYFQYSLAFGEDTLSIAAGNIGMFLAKYDSGGNAVWGRTPGGTANDYGVDVCIDTDGHVFVTGYFQSPFLTFGAFPLINSNPGYHDAFMARYNADGDAVWATSIGGQGHDYGMCLGSGPVNTVYLTGYFGSYSLDFSNTTIINSGSNDMYLAKLSLDNALHAQTLGSRGEVAIFPNPFYSTVNIVSDGPTTIEIYDMSSRKVFERQFTNTSGFDLSELAGGIYFYRCNQQGTVSTGKMIKK